SIRAYLLDNPEIPLQVRIHRILSRRRLPLAPEPHGSRWIGIQSVENRFQLPSVGVYESAGVAGDHFGQSAVRADNHRRGLLQGFESRQSEGLKTDRWHNCGARAGVERSQIGVRHTTEKSNAPGVFRQLSQLGFEVPGAG